MNRTILPTILIALFTGGAARADSDTTPAAEKPATDDQDPSAWASAPDPDHARGIEQAEERTTAQRLRVIPRATLFVPRWIVWGIGQPVRAGAFAYERYQLRECVVDLLFDTERTFGMYPTASYETDFGVTAGARLVHRDLFGAGERVKVRASFGGRYRQAYGVSLRSGERFGPRINVELDVRYERRPLERFFGIGNGDEQEAGPAPLIDPSVDDTAVATRFREDLLRNVLFVHTRVAGAFGLRFAGAVMHRRLAPTAEADSLDMYYRTDQLVGWNTGVDNAFGEVALVYDSRRPAPFRSEALEATGWLAIVHAGRMRGIAGDPSDFYTYGGELQRYFDLYDGSRVLAVRALVEGIAGSDGRTDGKASFIDLPRLGGTEYLRGYPSGRFRDRAITLGTVEYTWDLGNYLAGYVFVDVGRPWRSLVDIGDATRSSLRVGYGGGVQLHGNVSYLSRLQIAASRDGDVFVELALSPAFGRRERAGRF